MQKIKILIVKIKIFFLTNKLPIIFYILIFFINLVEIFDISNSFNRFKMLGYNFQVLGQQNEEEIRNFAFLVKKRMDWYSNISKISIFLLSIIFILMFLKIKNKKDILEIIKKNILMFFIIITGILKFYIIKNLNMNYLLIIMSLLAIVISIMKKFTNYLKKDNLIKGTDKSINLKIFISIIILLNIVGLVFFMNRKNNGLFKMKSLEQTENLKSKIENTNQDFNINNENYDKINAYCLGVGKATKNNSKYTTTFKASLCRINENVVRNITVVFEDNDININYDVSQKLFFAPIGYISYAKYNSNTNVLNIDLEIGGTALNSLPAGYILPLTSENIEKAFVKIVEKDLIEVYGSTLGILTVSESEFLNGNY